MRINVQAWGANYDSLADHFRSMLDRMEGGRIFRSHSPHAWRPRLNLYETPDEYIVCVELAGMRRAEIDVRAADGVLHICGERARPGIADRGADEPAGSPPPGEPGSGCGRDGPVSVHLMEIDSGRFHRRVPIPSDADVEHISAIYRHGYLWIDLPRRPH